jgi:hypothetical protein
MKKGRLQYNAAQLGGIHSERRFTHESILILSLT